MLNISENRVADKGLEEYSAFSQIMSLNTSRKIVYWILIIFALLIIFMFLPWTQNVPAKGTVTTLFPKDRPQSIYTTISGRIEKWYVREGETVEKGDTLAFLSEVKSEYFDPQLLDRTKTQMDAKNASRSAYVQKNQALAQQQGAIGQVMLLKMEQNENKIKQAQLKIMADSMDWVAAQTANKIALKQYNRTDTLYQKGLKSLTDLENKRNKWQATQAKMTSSQNKFFATKNELINYQIERNNIESTYIDKLSKSRSDQSSAQSSIYDAENQLAKLQTKYSNLEQRATFYYIIAPQDGYITKIHNKGIGEIIKEATPLLDIAPTQAKLAVECYIMPMDYPLMKIDKKVRFIFDGWPAFVFSGWPEQSYGTFDGKVIAIDNIANEKGKYRILVCPEDKNSWPPELRVGTGARGIVMLHDVPIWYEFWRQLNGFPPNYYDETQQEKVKLKAPAEHLKK